MAKGTRLAHRLTPDIPRGWRVGGSTLVVLLIAGFIVAFCYTPGLLPHQRLMGGVVLGLLGLMCILPFSRLLLTWIQSGFTSVEISADPVEAGREFRVFVLQRHDWPSMTLLEVRIVQFRNRGRSRERASESLIGTAVPEYAAGLRAQVEGTYSIPADLDPTPSSWAVEARVKMSSAADLIEIYPFGVSRPV